MALPIACVVAILPFLQSRTKDDAFQDMVTSYFEALHNKTADVIGQTQKMIAEKIKEENRKTRELYNRYRNIFLNHPRGNSDTPVSEWMNLSDWREWDD